MINCVFFFFSGTFCAMRESVSKWKEICSHMWQKIAFRTPSQPIFESIFYFSIKLPFHKFPLCQRLVSSREMMERKIFDWKFNLKKLIYVQIPFSWRRCDVFFSACSRRSLRSAVYVFSLHPVQQYSHLNWFVTSLFSLATNSLFLLIAQWMSFLTSGLGTFTLHKYIIKVMKTIPWMPVNISSMFVIIAARSPPFIIWLWRWLTSLD